MGLGFLHLKRRAVLNSDGTMNNLIGRLSGLLRPGLPHSLRECFELANDEVYTRSQGFLANRAYKHFRSNNRIEVVSDYLVRNLGLEKFRYVGAGDNAVVVQYSDCQALRIRAPAMQGKFNTHEVQKSPFICPVWKEVNVMEGRLNFVPFVSSMGNEVTSGKISKDHAISIVFHLINACFESDPPLWFYDYCNFDYKFEQIGFLPDRTPIIIDHGSVILESDAELFGLDRLNEDKFKLAQHSFSDVHSWDGKWHDGDGTPRLKLLERPPSAVLALMDYSGS